MKHKLILFDIDGTLLSVSHRNMRQMISSLLQEMELTEVDHQQIPFAGRTDKAIFSDLMGSAALDAARFELVKQRYLDALEKAVQPEWVETHAGAHETVAWCIEQNIPFGLLTGNFEAAAYTKLRHADLHQRFTFGAFGCEHADRNALPAIAHQKAEAVYGRSFAPEDIVIIGDTPNDVACARHYNARCIAVTTGPYNEDELSTHLPDRILNTMEHPQEWLHDFLRTS